MSTRKDAKVGKVMGEFKRGTLKSSSGKKVTNRKQALAIANSEGNRVMRKKMKKMSTGGRAKKQGYNARKDEQLGMTRGKESGKKMSMKGRRDVAKATRKKKGSYGFKKKGKA